MPFALSPHLHHCFLPAPSLPGHKLSLPSTHSPSHPPRCTADSQSSRDHLYTLVTSAKSRTQSNSQLETLIAALESKPQPHLALDPDLIGTWRNAYTSTPSSASIIQRSVVSSPFVPRVEQVIHPDPDNAPSKILNRVDLRKPLGCVLNVRAAVEKVHNSRLSIRFDRAWFEFDRLPVWIGGASLPYAFTIPYPVPFRLLGDKARGWLDVTYLDSDMRISRGNRGSCFVLIKEQSDVLPLTEQHLT